jgi:hypothetical protein
MVKPELQREILGVILLALSLFVLLALLPVHLIGGAIGAWFPSGNVIGVAGRSFREGGWVFFGAGVLVIPFLIALIGLRFGEWMEKERSIRMGALAGGLILLIPTFAHLLPVESTWGGQMGQALADPLRSALGGFGAGLFIVVLFAILSLATLGWNPFRPLFVWTWAGLRDGWERGWGWLEGRGGEPEANESGAAGGNGALGRAKVTAGRDSSAASTPGSTAAARPAAPSGLAAGIDDELPSGDDDRASDADLPWDDSPARALVDRPDGEGGSQLDLLPDPRDPRELAGDELPGIELLEAAPTHGRRDMERELDSLGDILVEKLRTFNVRARSAAGPPGPSSRSSRSCPLRA